MTTKDLVMLAIFGIKLSIMGAGLLLFSMPILMIGVALSLPLWYLLLLTDDKMKYQGLDKTRE